MRLLFVFLVLLILGSCNINNDLMLKTPKDYEFDTPPDSADTEYTIGVNDIIQFRLFSNDGFKIIDLTATTETSEGNNRGGLMLNNRNTLSYLVHADSIIRLPVLGDVKIAGLTLRESEDTLSAMYSEYYIDPFVQVNILNKRAIVFPGSGGNASVVPLPNNNTTLMEVLAQAGGISGRGKAARIKIMRRVQDKREIYLIDLSTIEGLKHVDMIIQANDYIYVEPVPEIAREILADVTPIVSIISSAIVVYTSLRLIQGN